MTITHVLLTRFNLPSAGAESFIRAKEGWLYNRVGLFERFSVPSVRAQSEPVGWLVYIDSESPQWLVDRLQPYANEGLLTLLGRQQVSKQDLVADLHRVVDPSTTRLVTTNLDNDDGLASDFSSRLRSAAGGTGSFAIYVDRGLVVTDRAAYLHTDTHNAFCSAVTDLPVSITCWEDWHNRLHLHMPVRHVEGDPGWLQVIHGTNVSNRVRGRRVTPTAYHEQFPGLLEDMPEPSRYELALDTWVGRPSRYVRDTTRGSARQAMVRALGKERFNDVKGRLAGLRSHSSAAHKN